ncbi:MAG: peptidoglycan-binding domain-containing protein [Candidatus Sulfotelmatobacter sp.]
MRNLSAGTNGPDVRALQEGLNQRNDGIAPPVKVDGAFGPETDKAIREYQARQQLKVDGIVGPVTQASIFHLAVATTTIFGQKLFSPRPSLKERALSGFLPGKLHLDIGPTPTPQFTPKSNLLIIPDDIREQMMDWTVRPYKFASLPKPIPAPVVPDLAPPNVSQASPWKYDHCELQPGGQYLFPFRRARQDAFTLTMQCIVSKGDPKGKHLEFTNGVQASDPLNATIGNDFWSFNPYTQITDVDRFGAVGNFHWWQPYAQGGFQASMGRSISPTLTLNVVPVNLSYDVTDFLTVTMAGGGFVNLDLSSGKVLVGPMFSFGVTLKFGAPPLPLSPFETYYHDLP